MNIIGDKFEFDFGMARAIFIIHSETALTFTIIEKDGIITDITETVATKMTELRPGLFMISWKEQNGNTITQIQDYENEIIYSNWTTPDGEFKNLKGTIKKMES